MTEPTDPDPDGPPPSGWDWDDVEQLGFADELDELSDADWDAGLAAAFADDSRAVEPESVLERVASRIGRDPRVHLDAPPAPASPVVRLHNDASRIEGLSDRYQILGEIARGGVGVVLKGRDQDLGRDLAMKVLRDDHADDPGLIQRFVEEAQIAGQLQHPGIVPVYELGLDGDGRPFFTMKLIEGRTLSALLRERADASLDLPRFLRIFEQVCDAVAYAHARHVVHRDLKPANVMVGAYGEVLVADWGFAKVLRTGGVDDELSSRREVEEREQVRTVRSGPDGEESQVGSVLGTPAYMPPEQARGAVEELDERSDVFALGAILCEILTGAPPYVGTEARELVRMAAAAELEDARRRLDVSGADGPLVELALRCLAPERAKRPADAAVLAVELARYLESLSDRARQAEVEAAEARVRAAEERKARRLTLGLAASVLVALGLGVGGWFWIELQQEARVAEQRAHDERVTLEVEERLQDAARLIGEAAWQGALSELRGARTRAADAQVAPELLVRADELAEEAETGLRQERLFTRLEELRTLAEYDLPDADAAYSAAFEDFGVDVEALPPAAAVAALALRTEDELEAALSLDDWARRRLHPVEGEATASALTLSADHLVALAKELDPDPWRGRLRDAALAGDLDRLRGLAGDIDLGEAVVESVELLGMSLRAAGDPETALDVYRRGVQEFPGDYLLRLHLAKALLHSPDRDHEELVRQLEVARALRPDDPTPQFLMVRALALDGRRDAARAAFDAVRERYPEHELLAAYEERVEQLLGETAVARLRESLTAEDKEARRRRIRALLGGSPRRRPDERRRGPSLPVRAGESVVEAFERLELERSQAPDDPEPALQLAQLRLAVGEPDRALSAVERAEALGGDARRVAVLRSLALTELGRFEDAARLDGAEGDSEAGRLAELSARFDEYVAGERPLPTGTDLLLLARVALARGRSEQAVSWFDTARTPDGLDDGVVLHAVIAHVQAASETDDPARAEALRATALELVEGFGSEARSWRPPAERLSLRIDRARLLLDVRLASVRDESSLESLPTAEARAWREAWSRLRRQSSRR